MNNVVEIDKLQSIFLQHLREIYDAETQFQNALPTIIQSIAASRVWQAATNYLTQSRCHVQQLQQLFDILHTSPQGEASSKMTDLITEGQFIVDQAWDERIQDVALVTLLQRMSRYKIRIYKELCSHLDNLAYDDAFLYLPDILQHERDMNQRLRQLN